MPNSTLPPDNYLGDAERTTGEFQDQINNLQNWVNALQAELQALSGTTVREGAVRSVDTSGDGLVDTGQLNTRLSTTGNLGTAATQAADQNLRTTDTVQFGRVTDAAAPGDGDFDSDKLGYWETIVTNLGGDFESSASLHIKRIGPFCLFYFVDDDNTNLLSFSTSFWSKTASGVFPSGFRPSAFYYNTVYTSRDSQFPFVSLEVETNGDIRVEITDFNGDTVSWNDTVPLHGAFLAE